MGCLKGFDLMLSREGHLIAIAIDMVGGPNLARVQPQHRYPGPTWFLSVEATEWLESNTTGGYEIHLIGREVITRSFLSPDYRQRHNRYDVSDILVVESSSATEATAFKMVFG